MEAVHRAFSQFMHYMERDFLVPAFTNSQRSITLLPLEGCLIDFLAVQKLTALFPLYVSLIHGN